MTVAGRGRAGQRRAAQGQGYLDTAGEHFIQDVSAFLHNSHVDKGGVSALAILDGVDEAIPKLFDGAQEVLLDEVHHAVVCVNQKARSTVKIHHSSIHHCFKTILATLSGQLIWRLIFSV